MFGEQPTRHFLDDERRYGLSKEIVEIVDAAGRHTIVQRRLSVFFPITTQRSLERAYPQETLLQLKVWYL